MNIPMWLLIVAGIVFAFLSVCIFNLSKRNKIQHQLFEAEKSKNESLSNLLSERPTIGQVRELERKLKAANDYIQSSKLPLNKEYSEIESELAPLMQAVDYRNNLPFFTGSMSQAEIISKLYTLSNQSHKLINELLLYKGFYLNARSNLTLFPYMAGIVSEFETRDIEQLACRLDWGSNYERSKKVASIRAIRHDAQEKIEQAKVAEYQLAYLLQMFPSLKDLLEYEYSELPHITADDLSEYDSTRDYLSKEEWESLSSTERNQLALDRYVASRKKTNWQVGRDYEEYVGYRYRQLGYLVDNFGAYMGLDDLGRDVIAKKGSKTYIIQCKYWSQKKEIHENHINQLFGTVTSYKIENNASDDNVIGVLITNTQLSDRAKKFAERLHINYKEHFEIGDFPRIKCNIGHSEWGNKIYHLPFDQQYDATKICNPGEFYALTVAEAERAGFRRAFKWHGA